jgi:hypothetical protein
MMDRNRNIRSILLYPQRICQYQGLPTNQSLVYKRKITPTLTDRDSDRDLPSLGTQLRILKDLKGSILGVKRV